MYAEEIIPDSRASVNASVSIGLSCPIDTKTGQEVIFPKNEASMVSM
jgi:hypothetical protein